MNIHAQNLRSLLLPWAKHYGVYFAVQEIPPVWKNLQAGVDENLSAQERLIMDTFRNKSRKASWIAGRLAARQALCNLDPLHGPWEILRKESGAPQVAGRSDIHLSITHSGSLALAVASPVPVGIDLERIESRPDSFLRSYFSAEEQAWTQIHGNTDPMRITSLWTRKEAYSKVLGQGGRLNFSQLPVLHSCPAWDFASSHTGAYAVSIAIAQRSTHG